MHVGLVLAKLVVVGIGLGIAGHGFRAHRRERSPRMLLVTAGFLLLSVGSVLESVFYDVFQLPVFVAGMLQTGFVAAGMFLILYSLYAGSTLDDGRAPAS